jgi:lipopolysaccharide transport system permease protein
MVRRVLARRPATAPRVVSRRVPKPLTGPPVALNAYRPSVARAVLDAWHDRHVLPWLSLRVVAKGFAGTRLGRTWIILRPALELIGMAVLFGAVFSAPSDGLPYVIFLLAGQVAWRFFQLTVLFGARSVQYYRRHASSISFAPLLVPIGASAIAVMDLVIHGLFLGGAIVFYAITDKNYLQFGPELLLAPVSLGLILLLAWAFAFWLSIVVAYVLDVRVFLRYILQFWMLITPVLYPLSFVPEKLHDLALANPVTPFVELFKWSLFGTSEVPMTSLYVALGVTAVLLVTGVRFHTRRFWGALAAMLRTGDDDDDF